MRPIEAGWGSLPSAQPLLVPDSLRTLSRIIITSNTGALGWRGRRDRETDIYSEKERESETHRE